MKAKQNKFLDYCERIMDFFESQGLNLTPRPQIKLDNSSCSRFDPFIPTGNYDYTSQTINLKINNRHCKDILRSFAHELIHHSQYLRDPDGYKAFDKGGKISENGTLRRYEKEAYERGNLLFRDWTEFSR